MGHPNPGFDLRTEAYKLFGVDVTQIPGLEENTLPPFSEVGRDMSRWPTAAHFVSWLALCPDNDISGGKLLWRGMRVVKNRAGHLFRLAVDVCEMQMRYVSRTQAQPRQHEYDRPVTKPSEVGTVTGCDQAFHVFCGQTLRQPGEPPVSDGGDREGEIVARFATEVEITQKCAEGGNQLLCGRSSTSAGTF